MQMKSETTASIAKNAVVDKVCEELGEVKEVEEF